MPNFLTNCRICNSKDLIDTINLGDMHLTGVFVNKKQAIPMKSPLNLTFCNKCKYLQIDKSVDPNLMYKEYWYRSGTNNTMQVHLKSVYNDVLDKVELNQDSYILDIGCNDGTLLNYFKSNNLFGCDPSNAIYDIKNKNLKIINDFFSADKFKNKFKNLKNKFKVITSISMFYDIENPNNFVHDIFELLDENGLWVVEMNYTKNIIEKMGFDMISHEHVGYYTILSFQNLINKHNLYINDISFNNINGGSIRFFCSKTNETNHNVISQIKDEVNLGLDKPDVYINLMKKINLLKIKLNNFLNAQVLKGKKIALYGASTRNETVLQFCGIDSNLLYAAAERNPGKVGLFTSGSRIPIKSEEDIRKDSPEFLFIGPYYFLDEFISREKKYLSSGGKFIIPLPEPMIIEDKNGEIVSEAI